MLTPLEEVINKHRRIRYWCGDESRMGMITLWARKLTGKGVQPVGIEQWCFDYFWLYGLVEPMTGESFFYEFCHLDSICFEKYLELFAQKFPEDFHVIQLDNGPLHQAYDLAIPENVAILFQPAYSPQVNPIERLWQAIKKQMKWELFDNLDELRDSLKKVLDKLTVQDITSLTKWQFLVEGLSIANI
jgi:transposase